MRPRPRSRATAVLGLVALALLQLGLVAHQFEHSADHGLSVCHVCTAYSQLEESPHVDAISTDIEVARYVLLATASDSPQTLRMSAAYHSRAPPHS